MAPSKAYSTQVTVNGCGPLVIIMQTFGFIVKFILIKLTLGLVFFPKEGFKIPHGNINKNLTLQFCYYYASFLKCIRNIFQLFATCIVI